MSTPYAPATSEFLLRTADVDNLPNAYVLDAREGLRVYADAANYVLGTTGNLYSLANMPVGTNGLLAYNANTNTTTATYLAAADTTITIANSTGVGGVPTLSVNPDTSVQQINVLSEASLISIRPAINFIGTNGSIVTVEDDVGNNRCNITIDSAIGSDKAPSDAKYIVQTPNSGLSAEQALSALATGIVKNTTTTGVLSIAVAGTDYLSPSALIPTTQGGTGSNIPSVVNGDLLIGNSTTTPHFETLALGSNGQVLSIVSGAVAWVSGGAGAPGDAKYIVQQPSGGLSAEQALSALATGIMKSTTTTGVVSIASLGTDYYGPGTIIPVTAGGIGFDPTVATGDLLVGVGGPFPYFDVLAPGSEGKVLSIVSGVPAWATASSGAPTNAQYILKTGHGSLPNAQVLGALSGGLVKNTIGPAGTGTLSIATPGTDYMAVGIVPISLGGLGAAPTVVDGDLLIGVTGSPSSFQVLNRGNDGDTLTMIGTSVSWSASAAPRSAHYILQTGDSNVPNAQVLGVLSTGLLKNTVFPAGTGTLSTATAGTDYMAAGIVSTSLGGSGSAIPTPVDGDLMVGDTASGTFVQFGVGGVGRVLTVQGDSTLGWNVPFDPDTNPTTPAQGGTGNNLSPADGDMLIGETLSGTYINLAAGNDGQFLGNNTGIPQWQEIPYQVRFGTATILAGNTSVTVTNGGFTTTSQILACICGQTINALDYGKSPAVVTNNGNCVINILTAATANIPIKWIWSYGT